MPLTFLSLPALFSLLHSFQSFYNTQLTSYIYLFFLYFSFSYRKFKVLRVKVAPVGLLYVWKVKSFYWRMQVLFSDQSRFRRFFIWFYFNKNPLSDKSKEYFSQYTRLSPQSYMRNGGGKNLIGGKTPKRVLWVSNNFAKLN